MLLWPYMYIHMFRDNIVVMNIYIYTHTDRHICKDCKEIDKCIVDDRCIANVTTHVVAA